MRTCIRFLAASFLFLSVIHDSSFSSEFSWQSFPVSGEIHAAYDNFRGIPDGSWNDNTGALIGTNLGIWLFDTFGVQAGGSYGVYDWYGRGDVLRGRRNGVQQQGFLTSGAYLRTPCDSGFQSALVLDWMFNKNFGVFTLNPSFGQLRLQTGYLWEGSNEFGFWGTLDIHKERKKAFGIPVSYRAISQINLFWSHFFENCAETIVWIGLPYKNSLMFRKKKPGQYIIGGSFRVPLTPCLSAEAHGVYMGPKGNFVSRRFRNYNANICVGLSYAFGSGSEGCCNENLALPYLPIANNSNFLVESSFNN